MANKSRLSQIKRPNERSLTSGDLVVLLGLANLPFLDILLVHVAPQVIQDPKKPRVRFVVIIRQFTGVRLLPFVRWLLGMLEVPAPQHSGQDVLQMILKLDLHLCK